MAGLLLLHVGLFLACAALSAAKARRLGRLMLGLSRTERRGSWFLRHCAAIVPRLLDLAVARESSLDGHV